MTVSWNNIPYKFVLENEDRIELDYKGPFLFHQYLEDNFSFSRMETFKYIEAFKANGFLDYHESIVAWEGTNFFPDKSNSLDYFLDKTRYQIGLIRFGENDLELIAKLGLYFITSAFSKDWDAYLLFETYSYKFHKSSYPFIHKYKHKEEVSMVHEREFKVFYYYDIEDENGDLLFTMEILVQSPKHYVKETEHIPRCHIIANRFDDPAFRAYIEKTLNYVKASSLDELRLKMALFAGNLEIDDLLGKPMTDGEVYRFIEDSRKNAN